MFKSKSFLCSSAALMMFLTLSAPGVQAMTDEERDARDIARKTIKIAGRLDDSPLKKEVYGPLRKLLLEMKLPTSPFYEKYLPERFKKIKDLAESKKDPSAQFYLGIIGLNCDLDAEPNTQKNAIANLKLAADQNFVPAQYLLGRLYLYKNGKPYLWKRRKLFRGNSWEEISDEFEMQDDERVHWLTGAAEQGCQAAQVELASLYETGINGVPDLKLTTKWFSKAVEGEDSKDKRNAQYELAQLYQIGIDGERSPKKALDLLTSLTKSHPSYKPPFGALYDMYHYGQGIPVNEVESLKWYMLAGNFFWDTFDKAIKNGQIRGQLQRNPKAPIVANKDTVDSPYLLTALTEAKCEHEFRARLHSSEGGFQESQFAIPELIEDYGRLADYGRKLHQVLESLSKTKPGFMITAVSPSAAFREKMDHYDTDQFFSLTTFDDEEYLTVGVENCVLAKLLDQLNEEMEEALWLLQTVKKPYEILLNKYFEAQAEQLSFGYRNRDLMKAFDEAKSNEEKAQIKEKQVMLKAEFDEKTKGFYPLDKGKVRQDIMHFDSVEETWKETSKFINEYIKKGVGARNKEFLKAYPFW